MSEPRNLDVLWRQKWLILGTVVVFGVVAGLISNSLQKIYATSSTLIVAQPSTAQTFDSVQAAQVVARTYADLLGSPNVAGSVAQRIGGGATRQDIEGAVSIEPVVETQLVRITAEDPSPERAKAIADAYADVFIDRSTGAASDLATTTKALVSLADEAPLPESPDRPKPTLYTLIAVMLGLAIGLGLAFLRERLDTRLRTLDEIESSFDLPVLARVPRRGKTDTSIAAFTESFRVLRTNLQFATPDGAPRTIAITSGKEGEGKTTTTSQLALVTAATGTNVLCVEADLRRPALQRFFVADETEPLRPGLSNYFLGGAALDDVIHPTSIPTVELVPAGPTVPSLSGLLESQRGRTAIEDLAACGDLVIFDTPPLGLGADAATVAGRVDGVILVVDMEEATEKGVRQSLRQLEAVRARVLGFVLNRDKTVEPAIYGYLEESTAAGERSLANT
ncbi:MAG: polysaccharide biosynthesis tyrosine autokinase [Solirubrobacteraceae bacterium]